LQKKRRKGRGVLDYREKREEGKEKEKRENRSIFWGWNRPSNIGERKRKNSIYP